MPLFKSCELVDFVKSMVGMPYWYGTCVYKCSDTLLASKTKQYPAHYTSGRMAKYKEAIARKMVCADCVGILKGFFWTDGGVGVADYIAGRGDFTSHYASNGCPDTSANGMLSWCKSKGAKNGGIATVPDMPGILLFMDGHVGVYIGNGEVIEARGFAYGVVKTKLAGRPWKNWAYMPLLDYSQHEDEHQENESADCQDVTELVYKRIVRKGAKGEDVVQLQKAMMKLGYELPRYGADGDCGTETVNAIMRFQTDNDLEVDGECGKNTYAALNKRLSGIENVFEIIVTGGSVNVRTAPNTDGAIAFVAHRDDKLRAVGVDSETGWFKLEGGKYISNKYAKKV